MAIERFVDDDSGYRGWRDAHPAGYIVNVDRGVTDPAGMRLHKASCFTLRDGAGGGELQTADYIKVCAREPRQLDAWSRENVGVGLRAYCCRHCKPSTLGLT